MPLKKHARRPAGTRPAHVFLNIPYDKKFDRLYLAYIAGISAFGLVPRATLEIPTGMRRLDRILELLSKCQFALHDLSRVEVDRTPPCTPRFNMPFELGLSVAWGHIGRGRHSWFVLESQNYRLAKSLSDLNGTDVHIHNGTIRGVFRALANAFVRQHRRPSVQQMGQIYLDLRQNLAGILETSGSESPFEARAFRDICVLASESADAYVV
jgi:hypothetical protein